MQLFILSEQAEEAATLLDDKRTVKMVTETAQIISSALWLTGQTGFYKLTHANHPIVKWAAADTRNLAWAVRYFKAICEEYTRRYGRQHKCEQYLSLLTNWLTTEYQQPIKFYNLAANRELGIDYTDYPVVTIAYQLYLNDRWDTDKREPKFYGNSLA